MKSSWLVTFASAGGEGEEARETGIAGGAADARVTGAGAAQRVARPVRRRSHSVALARSTPFARSQVPATYLLSHKHYLTFFKQIIHSLFIFNC